LSAWAPPLTMFIIGTGRTRADVPPTSGYSLVVDGHFKSHHDTVEAAEEAGMALKNKFRMLQVQVYDAENKTRSTVQWPPA